MVRPLSAKTSRDINAGIEEDGLSKAIRKEKAREDERRNRFAKKTIAEHERTASRASASSARARNEHQMMGAQVERNKNTLQAASLADEDFKEAMQEVIVDENERIQAEEDLEEEIKANHGKLPGYFNVPGMMRDKNSKLNRPSRSRSPRSRMLLAARTAELNPLMAGKPLPEGKAATIGPPRGLTALKSKLTMKPSVDAQLGPCKQESERKGIRVTKLTSTASGKSGD